MSSTSSQTMSPLECFANAMKLIIDASLINPRCSSIMPKVAAIFSNVAKDPRSKAVSVGPILQLPDRPKDANGFLVQAMSDLSRAAPFFGDQVNELMSLIISVMSAGAGPSGFASAEAGAETRLANGEQEPNDNSPSPPENRDVDSSTLPAKMKKPSKPEAPQMNAVKKKPSKSAMALESAKSLQGNHNRQEPFQPTLSVDRKDDGKRTDIDRIPRRPITPYVVDCDQVEMSSPLVCTGTKNEVVAPSKNALTSPQKKMETRSNISTPSYPAPTEGKRKEPDEGPRRKEVEPSLKRSKNYFIYRGKVMPPSRDKPDFYDGQAHINHPRNLRFAMTDHEYEERLVSQSKEGRNNTPLPVLQERYNSWKKLMNYMPEIKCIPAETYLLVTITSSGPSDALFPQERYKEAEVICKDRDFVNFLSIKKIILIPRPLNHRYMYYCIPNLHKWVHGSLHMNTSQEVYFKNATVHIGDIVYLPSGCNFSDKELRIEVIYKDKTPWQEPILRSLIPYVSNAMDSSTTPGRPIPYLASGWTLTNCHEYKKNRVNILGSIRPFVSDGGISTLHQEEKDKIIDLVCHVISMFSPYGKQPYPFFHSEPGILQMRTEFALRFLATLGSTSHPDYERYFRAEGIHFVFTNFVPLHVDTNNDGVAGMNETLAINCQCVIGYELAALPSVKKAMNLFKLDVGDPLSYSMVLYSRKVISNFVKKYLKANLVKDAVSNDSIPPLPESWWLIKPLLKEIENVNSERNTNKIWDDTSVWKDYEEKAKCDPGSRQYRGKYISLLPGYDRMRHWSSVKYLCDALHARNCNFTMNRDHIIGFICFAAFETNGTFLLSSIVDEVLSAINSSEEQFSDDFRKYGTYPALIFAAQCRNDIPCCESGYGTSDIPRFSFKNGGVCVDLSLSEGSDLVLMDDEVRGKIKDMCDSVVTQLGEECFNLHSAVKSLEKRKRCDGVEAIGRRFYNKIQEIGGRGVCHGQAINFIQLASIFGFIPYDLINWVCVGPTTSYTYQAINYFYKKTFDCDNRCCEDISVEDAQKHFSAAVQYIASNVSWNFTSAIAYNMLSIMYSEMDCVMDMDSNSDLHDVVYLYEHRKEKLHHLYRWKMDTVGKAYIQLLAVKKDGKILNHGISVLGITRDGTEEVTWDLTYYWTTGYGRSLSGGVSYSAKYKMTTIYQRWMQGLD